ncbi:hypothetical protein ACFVS2_26065 [Brevibacillus sp. NPDC058079]|uniref:hypothetical protein n=1 Tax=Brevibacillus sp. NPDC058079 TaxID=3346330 RepID=UPI0036ECAB38
MFHRVSLDEFEPVVQLFEEDNKGNVHAWVDMNRLFIKGDENEVMIRFNKVMKKITIARIQFQHSRMGYGSRLLQILKEYGIVNGYEFIELESMLTEEILSFATKHGFQRKEDGLTPTEYIGDWYLSIR